MDLIPKQSFTFLSDFFLQLLEQLKFEIKEEKSSALFEPIPVPKPLPLPAFDDDAENWDAEATVTKCYTAHATHTFSFHL